MLAGLKLVRHAVDTAAMEAGNAAADRDVWEIGLWQLLGGLVLLGALVFAGLRLFGSGSTPASAIGSSPAAVAREYVVAQDTFNWQAPTAGYAAAARLSTAAVAAQQTLINKSAFGTAGLRYDVRTETTSTFTPTKLTVQSLTATRAVVLVAGLVGGSGESKPGDPATGRPYGSSLASETVQLTKVAGQWKVSNVEAGGASFSVKFPTPTAPSGGAARTITAVYSDEPHASARFELTVTLPAGVTFTPAQPARGQFSASPPQFSAGGALCQGGVSTGGCSTSLSEMFAAGASAAPVLQSAGDGFLGALTGSGTTANGTIWARFHQSEMQGSDYVLTAPGLRTTLGYGTVTFGDLFTAAVSREIVDSAKLRAL